MLLRIPPPPKMIRIKLSLDNEPVNEIDEAWIQETERRYQDYKDGKVKGLPGDKIFSEIKRELGWQP